MAKKYSKEEFIKRSKEIFGDIYDYSKLEYIDSKTDAIIICKLHGEFIIKPSAHLSYKRGCLVCKGVRHNNISFIEKAKAIHGDTYIYDKVDFINVKIPVIITCRKHGDFEQTPDKHVNAGHGCQKCDISYKKDIEYVKRIGAEVHNNFYTYEKAIYKGMFCKICITCPIHGDFWQIPGNHLQHKQGCPKCYYRNKFDTQEEFINKAIAIHGKKYDYSKVIYKNSDSKIEIVCHRHGDFYQTPSAHLRGNNCPACVGSVSKKEIAWLDYLKIPLEFRQKIIKVNGKHFRVDAYDPYSKIIYEFYGDYWHGNPQIYNEQYVNKHNKKKFNKLFEQTINREKELIKLGFKIVSIWEKDWDKFKRK